MTKTFSYKSPMAWNRPATIPVKISRDIPLPIPLAVICSPSHMMKIAPAVRVTTVEKTNPAPGFATMLGCRLSIEAIPNAWKALSPTASHRV